MPTLVVYRGSDVIRRVPLSKRDVRIGRDAQNDIVLEDADKSVSRFHAELRYEQGHFVLIDLNSGNGTWINGDRIQKAELKTGEPVIIGAYELLLESSQVSTSGKPPSAPPRAAPPPMKVDEAEDRPQTMRMPRAQAEEPVAAPKSSGGAMAWLARQPKPLVIGAFLVLIVLILMLGPLLNSGEP